MDLHARRHHYIFAYKALCDLGLRDPQKFYGLVSSAGLHFLQALWARVGQDVSPDERLSGTTLGCSKHALRSGAEAIVVAMPPPERITEAWFVAFVRAPSAARLRCMTLEKSIDFASNDMNATTLGEWIGHPDTQHLNHGLGPAPTLADFVARLEQL
jgi:hypothetical protein